MHTPVALALNGRREPNVSWVAARARFSYETIRLSNRNPNPIPSIYLYLPYVARVCAHSSEIY